MSDPKPNPTLDGLCQQNKIFVQISRKGPPPEQWYRRWADHSLLNAFDVPGSGDSFGGFMLIMHCVALGALAVHVARWLLARLNCVVMYTIAAAIILCTDRIRACGFINKVFVSPAFSAESLEHRIIWAASFYAFKDALEYLPDLVKEHEMMPAAFDIIVVVSSLWALDHFDWRNKTVAWQCIESPRPLTTDSIKNTNHEFRSYHIRMGASVGMLIGASGFIAGRILIGTLAIARLFAATYEDVEIEMKARQQIVQKNVKEWMKKQPAKAKFPDSSTVLAKISASGPPPTTWYLRWKENTILQLFRRFPTDRSVVEIGCMFGIGVIFSYFYVHLMKWIYFKMMERLSISILQIIAVIFIRYKVEGLLVQRIPAFGCKCPAKRLFWAASFTAAYDIMKLLPASMHHSPTQLWDVVIFVSGIWNINQGDYFCKILSWEYTREGGNVKDAAGVAFEVTEYLNIIVD